MREMKFRIWDKTWKKFYYGELLSSGFKHTMNPNGPVGELTDWMQFTGLKDKNGKEIYESDVVKYFDEEFDREIVGYIIFKDGTYKIALEKEGKRPYIECFRFWNDGMHDWYTMENAELYNLEVIGNIHENKELVESK